MTVTSNAIRVQMPAGPAYQPALVDAAQKVASRSGLEVQHRVDFTDMVAMAAQTLNSGAPSSVVLEIALLGTALAATMTAPGSSAPDPTLMSRLAKLAADRGCRFESHDGPPLISVDFEVGHA
jgi:hypothetical protein